jgi:hypothetical protein
MSRHNNILKCGHSPNAVMRTKDGDIPCCVICDCTEFAEEAPDLTGRKARCTYCKREIPSSFALAFFQHQKDRDNDSYYCGCRGWN